MEPQKPKGPVYSAQELRKTYGRLFERGSPLDLQKGKVPSALWPLLPYAQFWGLPDDSDRDQLVKAADPTIQENLAAVVRGFEQELNRWLSGPDSYSPSPSLEYVAFSALRMAGDYAEAICGRRDRGSKES